MTKNKIKAALQHEGAVVRQFAELLSFIENKRSEASQAVNEKQLNTAWVVGGYVSAKLKSEEWGSKPSCANVTIRNKDCSIFCMPTRNA